MATQNGEVKDSLVTCQTHQGVEIRANLLRLTRYVAVFEVYTPGLVLRLSEVLEECRIIVNERVVYSGRAVVSSVVNTGTLLVCEVKLDEAGLSTVPLLAGPGPSLQQSFEEFLGSWQKNCRVLPEFKDVLGDLQSYLTDLRNWFDQVELEIRASPSGARSDSEQQVIEELSRPVIGGIDAFIERFEGIARNLPEEAQPSHRAYLRRQLHPLLLCSPFAYRTFHKPLGYAGDYEVVDMMMRPPHEGSTLFAKMVNVWLLGQAPVIAHRNRVQYLTGKLVETAAHARAHNRLARVYNLGCGPAAEIQKFLKECELCGQLDFSLLDFNDETLAHARTVLEGLKRNHGRSTSLQFVKRSVQQLVKDAGKGGARTAENRYDFVYCAGLFDYLSDSICRRLMNIFYEMLAPGGLLVATNVSGAMNDSRPFRYSMDYILDWQLIYRDGRQLAGLAPERAPADGVRILVEDSGVNVFIEVRKPEHG